MAMQDMFDGDNAQRTAGVVPRHKESPDRPVAASEGPKTPVSTEAAWRDGAHIVQVSLIYTTENPHTFKWGTRLSPEGKGFVALAPEPVNGTAIWNWAYCTCAAGDHWRGTCAHKAAAFILARNLIRLPPDFPTF